jgi:hypothetical protein
MPWAGPEAPSTLSVVARAILTEPSYWTPDLPSLYRLDARLIADGHELAHWTRTAGLRRLGVKGRSLWLDGRRYVPRGLVVPAASVIVERFRDAALAAVVADPSEAFLDECDAAGVAVVGLLRGASGRPLDMAEAAESLIRWAWHPAVLMALVPAGAAGGAVASIAAETRGRRNTLILAHEVDGSQPPPEHIDGAGAIVVSLHADSAPHPLWRSAAPPLPLVALRVDATASGSSCVAPSRHPCDALQAALAAWAMSSASADESNRWDWAGYMTGSAP